MKKILFLLASTFLLTGCIESVVSIGGGLSNGKLTQSSLNSVASYGIKKKTGETPLGHAIKYVKKKPSPKKNKSCSSFVDKQSLEICIMIAKRIISKSTKVKEKESSNKPSKELTLSLQSSIDKKSKIKYLD
jgi:hypothetical protein